MRPVRAAKMLRGMRRISCKRVHPCAHSASRRWRAQHALGTVGFVTLKARGDGLYDYYTARYFTSFQDGAQLVRAEDSCGIAEDPHLWSHSERVGVAINASHSGGMIDVASAAGTAARSASAPGRRRPRHMPWRPTADGRRTRTRRWTDAPGQWGSDRRWSIR